MIPNDDIQHDSVLAALRNLSACDVHQRRAQRLGARCRGVLASEARVTPAAAGLVPARWRHVTAIALLAAWWPARRAVKVRVVEAIGYE